MKTLQETRDFFAKDRFATEQCGIRIDTATDEYARCSMPLTPEHMNAEDVAQGGAIFTLCDTVFGAAANAEGVLTVSSSAQINFLRPGTGAFLIGEATLVSSTHSTCVYRVEVCDESQQLIAYGTVNGFRRHTKG